MPPKPDALAKFKFGKIVRRIPTTLFANHFLQMYFWKTLGSWTINMWLELLPNHINALE
jgi:hypothetical protein